MQNRHHQLVVILIALFTITQLVILFTFGYTPYPDSEGYIYLAKESIHYQQFYPVKELINEYPFLWNIGAVNAVVLSLRLFHSIIPLLIIYSIMKGATAWFLYEITKTLTSQKAALITLLIYVFYPANYGEGTSTLSELPFIFFCMLSLWLCINKKWYILGGVILAIANWFRPMAIIFLVALTVYYFYQNRKKMMFPIIGYIAMIILIGSLSFLFKGLFLYQAKTGWMALADYSSQHSTISMDVRNHQEWDVAQKDAQWKNIFMDWVTDHPMEYVAQIPKKLVNTFVSDNVNMCTFIPDKMEKENMYEEVSMITLLHHFPHYTAVQWLTVFNLLYYYSLLVLFICGLFYSNKEQILLPVTIITLGTLILLFFGHGEARFHIPFMPFIIMVSSLFFIKKY